jgi:hypothetical protein
MVTLHKDGGVKVLSPESELIPVLKAQGWVAEGEQEAPRRGRPPKEKDAE